MQIIVIYVCNSCFFLEKKNEFILEKKKKINSCFFFNVIDHSVLRVILMCD